MNENIKKKKQVLIVIDVQNDFITGCLGNKEAIETLPNIINLVKNKKFDKTFVTMDTHDNDYKNTLEGKKLPVEHCIKGTDGWKMPKELEDALNWNQNVVQTFEKPTFGSLWMADFIKSNLNNWMVEEGDDNKVKFIDVTDYEFTIVGFCTDICVVSNALIMRANFPNNTIKVIENCTAGVTPETKKAAIDTMRMCQIEII